MRGSSGLYLTKQVLFRTGLVAVSLAAVVKLANPHVSVEHALTVSLNLMILGTLFVSLGGACVRALAARPDMRGAQTVFAMHRFPMGLDYMLAAIFLLQAELLLMRL